MQKKTDLEKNGQQKIFTFQKKKFQKNSTLSFSLKAEILILQRVWTDNLPTLTLPTVSKFHLKLKSQKSNKMLDY